MKGFRQLFSLKTIFSYCFIKKAVCNTNKTHKEKVVRGMAGIMTKQRLVRLIFLVTNRFCRGLRFA